MGMEGGGEAFCLEACSLSGERETLQGNCPGQFQPEKGRFSFITQQCAWSLRVGSPLWGWRSVHFQFIYEFYPESRINGYETDLIFMSVLKPVVDMSASEMNCALSVIYFSGRLLLGRKRRKPSHSGRPAPSHCVSTSE